MRQLTIGWALALVIVLGGTARAVPPGGLLRTFTDPNPANGAIDEFGVAVATLGNDAVIAAPFDISDGNGAGLVYAFDASTGSRQLTLHNPAPTGLITDFGVSLTTLGGDIVVGAPQAGSSNQNISGHGAAYRYSGTTGSLLTTYVGPGQPPLPANDFGKAVVASGSNLLVGDPGYEPPGTLDSPNYGAYHVMNGTTGALTSTVTRSPPIGEELGNALAVGNGFVVAGAAHNSTFAQNAGTAYEFNASTGAQIHAFSSGDPRSSEYFGWSVAVVGNDILVGAPNEGSTGPDYAGAVYMFDAGTGNLLHTFRDPTPGQYDWFGYSMAVVGNQILIGSPAENSAFLYDATNYQLLHTFVNPGPSSSLFFGISVAGFSNGNYLIGAAGSGANQEIGAAYVFAAVPEPSTVTLLFIALAAGAVWRVTPRGGLNRGRTHRSNISMK